jgi:hypothetical protein
MRVRRGWIVLALLTAVAGFLSRAGVPPSLAQQSGARSSFRYGFVPAPPALGLPEGL